MLGPRGDMSSLKSISWTDVGMAACVRVVMAYIFHDSLTRRPEIVTPATDPIFLREAIFLLRSGFSPYAAGNVTPPPLLLLFYAVIPQAAWVVVHAVADIATAVSIQQLARLYQSRPEPPLAAVLSVTEEGCFPLPTIEPRTLGRIYLFSPLSVAACAAGSSSALGNAFVAMALLCSYEGRRPVAMLCLALATYTQVYALVLLPAVCQILYMQRHKGSTGVTGKGDRRGEPSPAFGPGSYALSVAVLLCWLLALGGLSYLAMGGSLDFLKSYRALVTAQDLTPNLGLFWYLFSLMFEPFRGFFSFVFNYHFWVYPIPILVRAPREPLFVACWTVICVGIFKSYPSVADLALSAPLACLFMPHFNRLRHRLFVCQLLLYTLALCPVMWHMWIRAGNGNANSYFTATIIFNLAQVMFLIELVRSYFKNHARAEEERLVAEAKAAKQKPVKETPVEAPQETSA